MMEMEVDGTRFKRFEIWRQKFVVSMGIEGWKLKRENWYLAHFYLSPASGWTQTLAHL